MQINKVSSAAMAAAAAMLFTSAVPTVSFGADAAAPATVHCVGVNSCKGTFECKSAKNSCKGTGWVSKSKADCEAAKGTVSK